MLKNKSKFLLAFVATFELGLSKDKGDQDLGVDNPQLKLSPAISEKIINKPKKWSLGIGATLSPDPYKGSPVQVLPLPIMTYQGDRLSVAGTSISYAFVKDEQARTFIQAFLYPEVFVAKDSDDEQLKQLNNRHYIGMVGIGQRLQTPYGYLKVTANVDFTGRTSGGYMIDFEYGKILKQGRGKHLFILKPTIGLQYNDQRLVNYYYGITLPESTRSGLSEYSPKGAFSPHIGLSTVYNFDKSWNLILSTRVNRLSNEIAKSPMVGHRYIFSNSVALTYSF